MARRKKGNPVHGWLVLDKPFEMTSTRAVGILKRLYFAQKVGHAGTLDPLATGILPIAFGEATKTVPFAVEGEKVYRFTVRWGVETETDDAEGEIVATADGRPTVEDIEALLSQFTGEIMQVPPKFSAIKVDGERAYALARDGEDVVLDPRPVVIDELRLVDVPDDDTAVFEARCGKGTYVRAIARDMGRALGCRGHVIALRRARVGPFSEENAVSLEEIEDAADAGEDLTTFLQPVEMALGEVLELNVSPQDAADLAQGRSILIRGRDAPILGGAAYAMSKGRIIALGEIEKGALHPTRVFNFGG
ncbi:tRNA pseudouridine(55) synthase TruB [Hyphomicrobium sp.]|uniref:tRNA pseudouridine(55) synthase TruB n=1 Tax=Hyphomicrobium sp. TaxID=82 RepID=UPI002BD18186|nr:tRNA pseudouridine(55) synthase TruB [Hyphomicrobium sp.]HRN87933.1 tRNA pseudouridine(55) synthase TruB [Hyphomicrobium sp.]HRQ28293.1 tRNA pseudouridine(55) synthase TruB [Hyphomicrobium sp.]